MTASEFLKTSAVKIKSLAYSHFRNDLDLRALASPYSLALLTARWALVSLVAAIIFID